MIKWRNYAIRYGEKGLRFKNHFARQSNIPFLWAIAKRILRYEHQTLTVIPVNTEIESPQSEVTPLTLAESFINEATYLFSLNECLCRNAIGCESFPRDFGCTFIGEGAREIDLELGTPITSEEAITKLHKAYDMGLLPIIGRFRGDALAFGVKNDSQLMTMCHCCPCCCLSTAMKYANKEAKQILRKMDGIKVEVDDSKCIGCTVCVDACVFDAISMVNDKAVINDACYGCGRCARACKLKAITIRIEDSDYLESTIDKIKPHVRVDGQAPPTG